MKNLLLGLCTFISTCSLTQWSNGGFPTNGWGNSSSGPGLVQWRSFGFGNFAGNGATPQARIHLNEFYLLNNWTGINGNLFRTDGNSGISNNWRMYTGATAAGSSEKFRITTLTGTSVNNVELGTVQGGSLNLLTENVQRVTILPNTNAPYNRDGFVGMNNTNPLFHLDINTQNPGGTQYGELLLRARITDDPTAYISFLNLATTGALFSPALMGKQGNNIAPALSTVGSITNGQDIAANIIPITRFFSAKNYDPTAGNFVITRNNVVANRRLFGWYNGIDLLMVMESNGHLGVGTDNPGNRIEINSDFYDPITGNLLGTPGNGPLVTPLTDNNQAGVGLTNATGFSGLRFSDLTSLSNPRLTNPGQGVLAVDEFGDVIYVDASGIVGTGSSTGAHNGTSMSLLDPTKVALGNELGGTIGQLLNDREIPMNNNNLYFTDDGANPGSENRIGIGTSSPQARMHIKVNTSIADIAPVGLIVLNNQINGSTNSGTEVNVSGGSYNSGSIINATGGDNTLGLTVATSDGSNTNYAISAYSQSLGAIAANQNYGVFSSARYGLLNIGGFFESYSNNPLTNENYGVKAVVSGVSNYNYGVYGAADNLPNNYAGYFQGLLHVQGSITASGTITPSDEQFKTDVTELTGAMDKINLLQPQAFFYDVTNYSDFNFESDQQMGLIAQQVEQVLPTIVTNQTRPAKYDSTGIEILAALNHKGVEYEELITLLVAGMQEQDSRIDSLTSVNSIVTTNNDSLVQVISDLNARLTNLENCLSNILPALCNANQMAVQQTPDEVQQQLKAAINVNLSDRNAIVLNQNVPNPFAESTVITYSIPVTVQKAQIHFYDGQGKLINSVEIMERGNGQLNVFANDLSTGVYTYSLVADGQIVSSKRMVKN